MPIRGAQPVTITQPFIGKEGTINWEQGSLLGHFGAILSISLPSMDFPVVGGTRLAIQLSRLFPRPIGPQDADNLPRVNRKTSRNMSVSHHR